MMGSVADVLTDAGHNVTILMPIIEETERGKYGVKSTKKFIFVEPDKEVSKMMKSMSEQMQPNIWKSNMKSPYAFISRSRKLSKLLSTQCNNVLSNSDLLEQIKNENYDLAVGEPFDFCAYSFFEAVNIRAHVAVLSTSRFDHVSSALGQPMATSYVPGLQSSYTEKMNIWERLVNTWQVYASRYVYYYVGEQQFENARKIVNIERSWLDVLPEASFVFTNQIPILDFPAPTFDKIVPIGGISVKTKQSEMKLAEKWDKILGIRKMNVLISFGSNAKSSHMPDEYKQSLLQVFKAMSNVTFIWKYENEQDLLANHLDNVYLGSWLPQNELLADPRLNLFLTHGGMASTLELSFLGKPCIMFPLFADQNRNAAMLKRHGGVEVLRKEDLADSQLIQTTIEKVLYNSKYLENAEELAEKLNNLPSDPREVLVKHVEFVARFGKLPTLDSYGRHLSIFSYYLLDIILIFVVILYIFYRVLKFVVEKCSRNETKTKND